MALVDVEVKPQSSVPLVGSTSANRKIISFESESRMVRIMLNSRKDYYPFQGLESSKIGRYNLSNRMYSLIMKSCW